MKAYEFSTGVTTDGTLVIPDAYLKDIPAGEAVRVIILVDEEYLTDPMASLEMPELSGLVGIIEEIKQSSQNLANIQLSDSLGDAPPDPPDMPDLSFDVSIWNKLNESAARTG